MAKNSTPAAEEKAPEAEAVIQDEAPAVEEAAPADEAAPAPSAGETIRVETTGNFMLYDVVTGTVIEHTGVTEAPYSPFIEQQLDIGQLKLAD